MSRIRKSRCRIMGQVKRNILGHTRDIIVGGQVHMCIENQRIWNLGIDNCRIGNLD